MRNPDELEMMKTISYESIKWRGEVIKVGDDIHISTKGLTDTKGIYEVGRIEDIFCRKDDGTLHVEIFWFFVKEAMEGITEEKIEEKQIFFAPSFKDSCKIGSIGGKVKVIAKGNMEDAQKEYKIWVKTKGIREVYFCAHEYDPRAETNQIQPLSKVLLLLLWSLRALAYPRNKKTEILGRRRDIDIPI